MNDDFVSSVQKFMDTMGITYNIELTRGYRDTLGRRNVCYEIMVKYMGEINYIQHHCYRKDGERIVYEGGNEIMGVKDGVLAYLGDNQKVDEYFDGLARIKARDYFDSDF